MKLVISNQKGEIGYLDDSSGKIKGTAAEEFSSYLSGEFSLKEIALILDNPPYVTVKMEE